MVGIVWLWRASLLTENLEFLGQFCKEGTFLQSGAQGCALVSFVKYYRLGKDTKMGEIPY